MSKNESSRDVEIAEKPVDALRRQRTCELQQSSRAETDAMGAELQAQFYERSAEQLDREAVLSRRKIEMLRESEIPEEASHEEERLLSLIRSAALNRSMAEEKWIRAARFKRDSDLHRRQADFLAREIQKRSMSWLFEHAGRI